MTAQSQAFCLSHTQQPRKKKSKVAGQTGRTRPRAYANAIGQREGRQRPAQAIIQIDASRVGDQPSKVGAGRL